MTQLSRPVRRAVVLAAALTIAPGFAFATAAGASTHHATHKDHAKHDALTTVKAVKSSKYGTILVTSSGRALYMLTAESTNKNACTASCTALWPPLTTKAKPKAGKGVKSKLLGTITRAKGVRQVTYKGDPLFLYSGDTGKGQANGEGIKSFGGTWYVLSDGGDAVTAAKTSNGTSSSSSSGGW